jgi:hypothetical protein
MNFQAMPAAAPAWLPNAGMVVKDLLDSHFEQHPAVKNIVQLFCQVRVEKLKQLILLQRGIPLMPHDVCRSHVVMGLGVLGTEA